MILALIEQNTQRNRTRNNREHIKPLTRKNSAATKIQAGFKGMKAKNEVKEKQMKITITEDLAATKIQQGFTEMKSRNTLGKEKESNPSSLSKEDNNEKVMPRESSGKVARLGAK
jgi:hypothetical protein